MPKQGWRGWGLLGALVAPLVLAQGVADFSGQEVPAPGATPKYLTYQPEVLSAVTFFDGAVVTNGDGRQARLWCG